MIKKRYALMAILLITVYFLIVFMSVDYDFFEFKLSVKAILRQELTAEEMKNSNVYKAYKQIKKDTEIQEINHILNKKSRNRFQYIETWYYPYGYVGMWCSDSEKPSVFTKILDFKFPYAKKISEEELYSVFGCNSVEEINRILGEPTGLGEVYNKNGQSTEYYYSWGLKTKFSQKFIDDIKNNRDLYVSLPVNDEKRIGKFILNVTVRGNGEIEKFSLVDYRKRV